MENWAHGISSEFFSSNYGIESGRREISFDPLFLLTYLKRSVSSLLLDGTTIREISCRGPTSAWLHNPNFLGKNTLEHDEIKEERTTGSKRFQTSDRHHPSLQLDGACMIEPLLPVAQRRFWSKGEILLDSARSIRLKSLENENRRKWTSRRRKQERERE